jgi:tape measure domain-containing protein
VADINVGDITGRLRLTDTGFAAGVQQATQRLQELGQQTTQASQRLTQMPLGAVEGQLRSLSAASQQATTAQQQTATATTRTTQAFQSLGTSAATSSGSLNQLSASAASTSTSMQAATASAGGMGAALRTALSVAAGLGLATSIAAIASAVKNLATESVALASRMEGLNLAFRAIDGSAAAANSTMTFLFNTAKRLGVDLLTTVDSFRRLDVASKGTSLEGEGIRKVFEQITAGASRLGVSSESLQRALVAVEQMMTKGKLSAEELRGQLGDAIPGSLQRMAEGLGITTAQLERFVAAGIIPVNAGIVALAERMSQFGGGNIQEPVNRLAATFNNLTTETKAWMTAIGEGLGTIIKPWLDTLIKISEKIREIFSIPIPGTKALPQAGSTAGPLGVLPNPYTDLIAQSARKEVVDPGLVSRVMKAESGFNPNAVSPKGALGLMQLMPETAKELDIRATTDKLADPAFNISLGVKYLSNLIEGFRMYNDQVKLAVAAYNAGPDRVMKDIAKTRASGQSITYENVAPNLPPETRTFVGRVFENVPTPGAPAVGPPAPPPPGTAAAPGVASAKALDEMVTAQEKSLALLPQLQQQFDALAQSGNNIGGILDEALTKKAQDAVKEFSVIAERLVTFPGLIERLTPAQQEQLTVVAKQVALFKQRADDQVKSPELALLKTQIEQLEALTIRRRADRIEQAQGQEAADRFTRAETAALALRQLGQERQQALLPMAAQVAAAQDRVTALTAITEALGAQGEAEKDSLQRREAILAIEKRLREQEVQGLERLQEMKAAVSLTAAAQKELTAAKIAAKFPDNEQIQALAEEVQALEAEKVAMLESFNAIKLRTDAQRDASDKQEAYNEKLRDALAVLQVPKDERASARLRLQAPVGAEITPEQEQLLGQIRAQERLNYAAQVFEQFGNAVGSAWGNALQSIANGTITVAGAFRAMAQSIIQSLAQIASQEAWKALIRVGVGLIAGAATGGLTSAITPNAAGYASPIGPTESGGFLGGGDITQGGFGVYGMQGGGIINKPTRILAGENPAMNPEYVVNHPQMQALMGAAIRSAPSAGGQATGAVSVFLVDSRNKAEEGAQREAALGRKVIIQEVLSEMRQGESSQINRLARVMQR